MRKIAFCLLLLPVLFSLFSVGAFADGEEMLDRLAEVCPPGVPTTAEELAEALSAREILGRIGDALGESVRSLGSFFSLLCGLCVLLGLSSALIANAEIRKQSFSMIALIGGLLIWRSLSSLTEECTRAIRSASSFFSALTPIMTAVSVGGGGSASAAVLSGSVSFSLLFLEWGLSCFALPLVSFFFALALFGPLGQDPGVSAVGGRVRTLYLWLLGIITVLYGAVLSLQSVLGSAADGAGMRAAKFAVGNMIPMVGSAVAGSLSTLAASLGVIRSTVGVSGICALCAILLLPILRLLLCRAALDVSSSVLSLFGVGGDPFSPFRYGVDALIGTCVFSLSLCLLQTVVFLKTGVAIG